jgi:hypothetical protein
MVFFSSCNSVKYHGELLNYIDIPVKDIHGKQKQQRRTSTFFEFCQADKGILLCTDVAARGLDIPGKRLALYYMPWRRVNKLRTCNWLNSMHVGVFFWNLALNRRRDTDNALPAAPPELSLFSGCMH